MFYAESRGSR